MSKKFSIKSDYLLLVEGRDECNLLGELIKCHFGKNSPIQLLDGGGKDRFPTNIKAIRKLADTNPTLQSIGVIRDADDNPKAAFESVSRDLRKVGYDPPNTHNMYSEGSPAIGIFIVPDFHKKGAIETLCRLSVEGDEIAICAEQYLECLKFSNALISTNPDKSFAHAYLAATQDPLARVGEGALQGVWNFSSPVFNDLTSFVKGLDIRDTNFGTKG